MPVFVIDAPSGVPQDAKRKMMKEVTEALHEAAGRLRRECDLGNEHDR